VSRKTTITVKYIVLLYTTMQMVYTMSRKAQTFGLLDHSVLGKHYGKAA